jgi:hypothetical protein
MRVLKAMVLLALGLTACSEQQLPLSGSSAQYLNVEGKRIQVRISPSGGPGEYRLMTARDTMVINPDVENERRRAEYAADYYMKQGCTGRGYRVLESGMLDDINYYARFRCNGLAA